MNAHGGTTDVDQGADRPAAGGQPGRDGRHQSAYNRRTVLRAALSTAGAVTGAATLGGRTRLVGAQATPSPAAAADGVIYSPVPGVPPLYTEQPPIFRSVPTVPGRGGTVSSFHISYGNPPIPPRDENRYWRELETRLGVTLEPTIASAATYQEQLAVRTASGDLPDLTLLILGQAPDQYRAIREGAWTDLSPYLTGSPLAAYPNLAAFPDFYWKNVAIDGRIYGVPRPVAIADAVLMFRQDWADSLRRPRPENAEEFFQLMVAMTENDPDGNGRTDSWGLGGNGLYDLQFFEGMFRVPNQWRLDADGTLTSAYETDEFRQAVAYVRRLFEAGTYHPEAGTMNTPRAKELFAAGKFGAYTDGYGAVEGLRGNTRQVTPTANPVGLVPPGHDGNEAVTHNGSGILGFVAIPAEAGQDEGRVRELLGILDYFCAPFGSEEELFLNFGFEDVHHEVLPDGTRDRTDRGDLERGALANLTEAPPVIYISGGDPSSGVRQQRLLEGMLSIGIDNPTLNAFSPTQAETASELSQLTKDRLGAIITGRASLDALDAFVADWRSRGGDQIRREYEEDLRGP